MIKRWAFWLPFLYLAGLIASLAAAALLHSGTGEQSLPAWILIFSSVPAMLIARAFGAQMDIVLLHPIIVAVLQALALLLIGVAIDALVRPKRSRK
jgi:hypothetical protein